MMVFLAEALRQVGAQVSVLIIRFYEGKYLIPKALPTIFVYIFYAKQIALYARRTQYRNGSQ